MKILYGIITFVVITIIVLLGSYINANNYGAKVEANLVAAQDQSKNVLAQYNQRIMEVVQVPTMYKDDLKEVLTASMQGRYGENGSQATFQWLKENNLSFDSKLYTNIQDLIASGRKDFENSQKRMIDIRKGYDASLNVFWKGFWLSIAGYPKLDLTKFKPVTSTKVETTFETLKEEAPLKLR